MVYRTIPSAETGMGVDIHVRGFTRASLEAITNALPHTSLYFVNSLVQVRNLCELDVTIAVPDPDALNGHTMLNMPHHGLRHINVAKGIRSPE